MAIHRIPVFKKGVLSYREGNEPGLASSHGYQTADGGTNFVKMLKHWLRYLGVYFYDPCCDSATTFRPLRYNVTDGRAEYFNGTTWVATSTPTAPTTNGAIRYDATSPSLLERYNGTTWVDIPAPTPAP